MIQLWQDVGDDFRDCLRASDSLVRTMTSLLVGMGKILRELSSATPGTGSNSTTPIVDESAVVSESLAASTASNATPFPRRSPRRFGVLPHRLVHECVAVGGLGENRVCTACLVRRDSGGGGSLRAGRNVYGTVLTVEGVIRSGLCGYTTQNKELWIFVSKSQNIPSGRPR